MKRMCTVLFALFFVSVLHAKEVTIPNGAVVPVKTTQQLSSDQLTVGQEVILNVAQAVKVKGQTVIAAGAPVYASVEEAKKGQMAGIPGSVVIAVKSTTAVDGSNIILTGSLTNKADSEVGGTVAVGVILCPLALLNKGDDGTIPVGAQIRSMTMGEFPVEIDKN